MQLRSPSEELIKYVFDTVKKDNRAAVTKEKQVKGGVDYYLSSQKYLQILGKKIKERFSGEYKLTSTLHTERKDGKKLYRITILFREYPFKVGDIVIVDGEEQKVLRIGNNQVAIQNIVTHKKDRVPPDRISLV